MGYGIAGAYPVAGNDGAALKVDGVDHLNQIHVRVLLPVGIAGGADVRVDFPVVLLFLELRRVRVQHVATLTQQRVTIRDVLRHRPAAPNATGQWSGDECASQNQQNRHHLASDEQREVIVGVGLAWCSPRGS